MCLIMDKGLKFKKRKITPQRIVQEICNHVYDFLYDRVRACDVSIKYQERKFETTCYSSLLGMSFSQRRPIQPNITDEFGFQKTIQKIKGFPMIVWHREEEHYYSGGNDHQNSSLCIYDLPLQYVHDPENEDSICVDKYSLIDEYVGPKECINALRHISACIGDDADEWLVASKCDDMDPYLSERFTDINPPSIFGGGDGFYFLPAGTDQAYERSCEFGKNVIWFSCFAETCYFNRPKIQTNTNFWPEKWIKRKVNENE